MDRLFISAPQDPPRLPGPPTFGSGNNGNSNNDHAIAIRPNNNNSSSASSRKKPKHVHFRDARVVSFIAPGSSMTMEERNELWYPTADLDGFKVQARTLSRKLREPALVAAAAAAAEAAAMADSPQPPPPEGRLLLRRCRDGSVSPPPPPLSDCVSSLPAMDDDGSMVEDDGGGNKNNGSAAGAGEGSCDGDPRGLEHRVCLNRQRNKHLAIRCTLKAQSRSRCPEFIARISGKCTQWAKELAVAEADRDYCEAYCPQKLAGNPKVLQNESPFPVPVRPFKRCYGGEEQAQEPPGGVEVLSLPATPQEELVAFPPVASLPIECSPHPAAECNGAVPLEQQQQQQQFPCFMERCVRQKRDGEMPL